MEIDAHPTRERELKGISGVNSSEHPILFVRAIDQ
jgi:hypothetical protein